MNTTASLFQKFIDVVAKLRDPAEGCPWDLEQTNESIKPYLIEEAYEVLEAIEESDDEELSSELGDVLLQVVLHSQIAKDRNAFDIDKVLTLITEKMIRRHPHVFGETNVSSSKDVLQNWENIKNQERKKKVGDHASLLADVPKSVPALHRAARLGDKASKVNFDWNSRDGVWDKIQEELGELRAEIELLGSNQPNEQQKERLNHELGDLLFSLAQLARWLDINPEESLRACSNRFVTRFRTMEQATGDSLREMSEEQLEAAWQNAKRLLASEK